MLLFHKRFIVCSFILIYMMPLTTAFSQESKGLSYWQTANVYKIFADTAARYQKAALIRIKSRIDKDSDILNKINFYIALDHLILAKYNTQTNNHLNDAIAHFKKAQVNNINTATKALSSLQNMDMNKCISILNNPNLKGNKLIHIYLKYLETGKVSYLDTTNLNSLIKDDYDTIKISLWKEPLKLYNPFTWYCLSQLFFEKSRLFFEKEDLSKNNSLYFMLDTYNALKKYENSVAKYNDPRFKNLIQKNHYITIKLAESFFKLNNKEQANALIQKIQLKCSAYVHFEIAHYISEVLNDSFSAKQYLFKNAPDDISPRFRDYHHLSDSTAQNIKNSHYYRTLGKIYKQTSNLKASFRCFYYVYRHSFGLDMSQYDPKYLAYIISTALNQNVRPLLDEYLLRPPGKFGTKSFIDMYPGAYALMYYFGCLNKLDF